MFTTVKARRVLQTVRAAVVVPLRVSLGKNRQFNPGRDVKEKDPSLALLHIFP
jgi:hypothetical protein